MPYPQNKPYNPPDLPNPELNPLLNPKLGQNLGRWAQVYFTNPPEKREEAVLELLRQIDAENGVVQRTEVASAPVTRSVQPGGVRSQAESGNGSAYDARRAVMTASSDQSASPRVICGQCHGRTEPGQKFCGFCGARIETTSAKPKLWPKEAATAPVEDHMFFAPPSERAAPEPTRAAREPVRAADDVEWLRSSSAAAYEDADQSSGGWAKYAVLGLLLLLAAFGYLEYVSRQPEKTVVVTEDGSGAKSTSASSEPSSSAASGNSATTTPNPAPKPPEPSAGSPQPGGQTASTSQDAQTEAGAPRAAANNQGQNAGENKAGTTPTQEKSANSSDDAAGENTAEQDAPARSTGSDAAVNRRRSETASKSAPPDSADTDSGAEEFQQAQNYMQGRYGAHDSATAARLLWKAVAKENTPATLMLADMYMHGNGVTKSCDQARVLLMAATRKGSSDAAAKLRTLETGGCR